MRKNRPIIEDVRAVILIAICVVIPLFMRDYYFDIDGAKFDAFKLIMFMGIPSVVILSIPIALKQNKDNQYKGLLVSLKKREYLVEKAVLLYAMACVISFIAGGYYDWTFWGASGWYMGLFTQLSCIFLFFIALKSRRYSKLIILFALGTSVIVCALSTLNSLYIDPIGCYTNMVDYEIPMYLSTIGATSWLGQYIVLMVPFAMLGTINKSAKRSIRILYTIVSVIVYSSGILQNGDGIFLSIFAIFCTFGAYASRDSKHFNNWWVTVAIFFASALLDSILVAIFPNPYVEYDLIPRILLNPLVSISGIIVALLGVYLINRKQNYSSAVAKRTILFIIYLALSGLVLAAIIIFLSTRITLPEPISHISYLNWSDEWGNWRGWNWAFSSRLFVEYTPLLKLFGTGPDGYFCYAGTYHLEEMQARFKNIYVFNAHNEYLNMLICCGILGLMAYLSVFVTYILTLKKSNSVKYKSSPDYLLVAYMASTIAYAVYAVFAYQTVTGTPILFILLGLGMANVREGV